MAFRFTSIGALIESDPKAAYKKVRAALAMTKGHQRLAAQQLGVSERALKRWIKRLGEGGLDARLGLYPKGRRRASSMPGT